MPAKSDTDIIFRYVEVDRSKIDRTKRLVPFSFSSEFPALQRNDKPTEITRAAGLAKDEIYVEILDHAPDNVDLSLLKNRGAFLDEHDDKDQIGVVETCELVAGEKVGRAVASLDTHEKAETRLTQMERGSRPHISAGYKYTRFLRSETLPNGRKAVRFAWRALEVSSVAIPADPSIGVARNYTDLPTAPVDAPAEIDVTKLTPEQKTALRAQLIMPDKTPAEIEAEQTKLRATALGDDRKRAKEIMTSLDAYVKDHGDKDEGKLAEKLRTLAGECLYGETPTTIGEFQRRAMEEVIKAKPAKQTRMEDLGYDEQDRNSYSLCRAIQNCLKRGQQVPDPDTIEGDAHVRMAKLDLGVPYAGFLVPADANINQRSLTRSQRQKMQRDLVATNFGSGGATVATNLVMPIIEILRNKMVTDRIGVRTLSGLQGNIVIPRQTATATAYSVPEQGALTLSTQTLDQVAMTPHRVGAMGRYSKQLLLQSSMDVENFVRDDLLTVIALDWDRLTLNGQGAGAEPLGLINTPGIGSLVFGGAATFAKLVAMETAIAVLNATPEGRAYLTTSGAKGILKSAAKLLVGATTVAAQALWENDQVNGYPAHDSQQIPLNLMLFGAWSDIIKGLWGGLDVVVDIYSAKDKATVEIAINTFGDVVTRHPQSFCVSADSAAQ